MALTPPDLLRAVAVVGLVPALHFHGGVGLAVAFLALGGCFVPRALGSPVGFDALVCATAVLATWAALLDWYVALSWLDLAVHALLTGLVGVLAWQVVERAGLLVSRRDLPRARAAALLTTVTSATTLATLWEVGEWWGHTFLDPAIQVGQTDTVTDLLAGFGGAVVAGLYVARTLVPAAAGSRPLPTVAA